MNLSRRPRRRTRENIVPLVNIVFLLLIFFMLAGTLRGPEALEVEPPELAAAFSSRSPSLADSADPQLRTLILDRAGALALDGQIVEVGMLPELLLADTEPGSAQGPIRVRADRRARAEHLLPLLATLSRLGFQDVALVTHDAS